MPSTLSTSTAVRTSSPAGRSASIRCSCDDLPALPEKNPSRSSIETMSPRRLAMPSTQAGTCGRRVTFGGRAISETAASGIAMVRTPRRNTTCAVAAATSGVRSGSTGSEVRSACRPDERGLDQVLGASAGGSSAFGSCDGHGSTTAVGARRLVVGVDVDVSRSSSGATSSPSSGRAAAQSASASGCRLRGRLGFVASNGVSENAARRGSRRRSSRRPGRANGCR